MNKLKQNGDKSTILQRTPFLQTSTLKASTLQNTIDKLLQKNKISRVPPFDPVSNTKDIPTIL
ncbi:hypothetical protein [Dysgonomonas termitidis]|uniref:Uncharacterized protein n=1 Tax=Dysgonomonas termitidis TaxID=1516126 RepID=A0ABV9KQK0_9BACT